MIEFSTLVFVVVNLLGIVAAKQNDSRLLLEEEEFEIGFITTLHLKDTPLDSFKSKYQQIDVYESAAYASNSGDGGYFGKVLVLDGNIQLTEKDAPNYNEMMAHIPLVEFGVVSEALPKKVLVIGGGDGYVVSEVLKHPSVTHVDHVELDQGVIDVSARHFSWNTIISEATGESGSIWDDERVTLHVVDAAEYVRNSPSTEYDVIIQDSSDPFVVEDDGSVTILPSSVLYTQDHFQHLQRIMTEEGVLSFQAETYNIPSSLESIRKWRYSLIRAGCASVKYATIAIPTYSTGQIGMYVCQKQDSAPVSDVTQHARRLQWAQTRFESLKGETTVYYHPRIQNSCYDLPYWVEKYIYSEEMNEHGLEEEL